MVKKNIKFIIALVLVMIAVFVVYSEIIIEPEAKPLVDKKFPERIGDWTAKNIKYDDVIQRVLMPDITVFKQYSNINKNIDITLFMAYYNTLEKAELSHSPVVCFTGQGWDIKWTRAKEIQVHDKEKNSVRVNEMVQTKLGSTLVTLYWYQSANRAFANRGKQKIALFFERLLGRPDRNAFIRLTAPVPPGGSIEATSALLYSFLTSSYPEINGFFI